MAIPTTADRRCSNLREAVRHKLAGAPWMVSAGRRRTLGAEESVAISGGYLSRMRGSR